MKKNQRNPINKRSIKDILILITGLIVILGIAHFPEEKELFAKVYTKLIKDNTEISEKETFGEEVYSKVTNEAEPSYLFLVDKLKSVGLETYIDEFLVHEFSDSAFKYRWKRSDIERTWEVYKDHSDSWAVNELP